MKHAERNCKKHGAPENIGRCKIWTLITCTLIGTSFSLYTAAHPHSWIALKSDFILNSQGQLTEIRQRWEFDLYYSAITFAEVMNTYGDEKEGLQKLSSQIVGRLAEYHYFSTLKLDDSEIQLPEPKQYQMISKKKEGELLLEMEMHFDVVPPLTIDDKTLTWSVFDPTYYIEMAHVDTDSVVILGDQSTECAKKLELPDPSKDLIDYAQSLDVTQKDTDGLGFNFAEKVTINCR